MKLKHLINCALIVAIALLRPVSVKAQEDGNGYPVYVVNSGDTLSSIAARFGIGVNDIILVNDIINPNNLPIGTEINIPGFPGIAGKLNTMPIPLGADLKSIATTFSMDPDILAKLNRITSPNQVYAGTVLIIPITRDSSLQPRFMISASESLLEGAIKNNSDKWKAILNVQEETSWDFIPGMNIYLSSSKIEIASIPQSPIAQISISPLPLFQGTTAQVLLKTNGPVEISGSIGSTQINFFEVSENEYISLTGINALQEPGLVEFRLTNDVEGAKKSIFSQNVIIESGKFIQEAVIGVDTITIETSVIVEEENILSQIPTGDSQKLWDAPFNYPVDEPCIGSTFGNRRNYNYGAYEYYHTGVDFVVCANNLNIYAPASGKVIFVSTLPIKGLFTLIDHGWGVFSGYAHQSNAVVETGDIVVPGQLIGTIGNTGRSVGPHLHWEVWVNRVPVNALDWVTNEYPNNIILGDEID